MTQSKTVTIEATYRIVTPMFCSGADQTSAELRVPSFKGALRFWWRSLMWGRVSDHRELQQKEAELFGASDQRCGQSRVQLRISSRELEHQIDKGQVFEGGKLVGAHYLGYGVMEAFDGKNTKAGRLTRPMIPGGHFTVSCRFSRFATDKQIDEVRRALILLGTVGGLGSRSRRGFGSLTLKSLTVDDDPQSLPQAPAERLHAVVSAAGEGLPDWTAWGQHRVVVVTENGRSAVEVLDDLGREFVHYRSWGRGGKVLGLESERNFQEDHHLSKGQSVAVQHPRRVAFGLPHNYGKYEQDQVQPANSDLDRRASPLLLHVHQVDADAQAFGLATFLPGRFLPDGESLKAFGKVVPLQPHAELWRPIHGFLDRLIGKAGATGNQTNLNGEEINLG